MNAYFDEQALKERHAWKNLDLGWFGPAMGVVKRPRGPLITLNPEASS